jgi:hypothetical protein
MRDGKKMECNAGEVSLLPIRHAWVVGNEPVVLVDGNPQTPLSWGNVYLGIYVDWRGNN